MGNSKNSSNGINWFLILAAIGLGYMVWKVGK